MTSAKKIEWTLITGEWPKDLVADSPVAQLARDAIVGNLSSFFNAPLVQEHIAVNDFASRNAASISRNSLETESQGLQNQTEKELLQLIIGVACFRAFIQVNWTGPDLDIFPSEAVHASVSEGELNAQSIAELALGGEPAYHLAKAAVFLRMAQQFFDRPYNHLRTVIWWKLRAVIIHQRILDEPVAVSEDFFVMVDQMTAEVMEEPDLLGRFFLEQGLLRHHLGNDKAAAELFVKAARAMGLEYQLTGALGRRTKFQQTDLSQLVLLAESRNRSGEEDGETGPLDVGRSTRSERLPETLALNDDTLLEQTEFTSSRTGNSSSQFRLGHIDPSSQPPLHPLDQCVLLSLCLNVRNTSPSHGLTNEQMTPYVARVISHPRNWSIHTMALLLRSRLESTRTRTVERSTLQLQALVDQMPTADSTVTERLVYFHSIPLPSKWEMEKELALRFLALGVVRSALDIFERLEMWEEVVKCWMSMERPEKGIAIVRDLLEGRKEEADAVLTRGKAAAKPKIPTLDAARAAKLWCLLGDLEPANAEAHYTYAWSVSGQTSGRAMRSLGGYYFARNEFSQAIECLQKAVKINPLLARTWFVLGCACVREEMWEEARDAFSRCVGIDDEDGESWSNLASVYLRMGEKGMKVGRALTEEDEDGDSSSRNDTEITLAQTSSGTIPFSNKILAYRALKQGLKFSYSNWRMWSNYMIVAMDVGELAEACRALSRVIEERAEKVGAAAVDEDVLERLVDSVTRTAHADVDPTAVEIARSNPNEGYGLLKRVEDVFTATILPRVSSSPRVFRAYARLLTWQNRWGAALDAHLNAYRCSVASDDRVETDLERWKEAVGEVGDLVDVLRNLGPRADAEREDEEEGTRRGSWNFQARGVIRTFIGRTKASFEDEREWGRLEEMLEELKRAE